MQELQEPELHEEQPDEECSTPLMPNTENFFFTSSDPQCRQKTFRSPNTSFSNSCPHFMQVYSYIGIAAHLPLPPVLCSLVKIYF